MSDKDGNIDDLIRDGFHLSDDDFDFGSWSDVEKNLDPNAGLDQQIVQAFNETPEEVPIAAWPEINEELDIDTVWGRIESKMTKKKRRAFIWWNAAAIGILLLLAGYVFQDEFTNEESVSSSSSATFDKNESTHSTNSIENSEIINNSDHVEFNNQNGFNEVTTTVETANIIEYNENFDLYVKSLNGDNKVADNGTILEKNVDPNNDITVDENAQVSANLLGLIQPLNGSPINKLIRSNGDNELPEIEIKPLEEEKPIYPRKWIVGVFGSINNSIISDATTREAFSANSLVSNNFTVSMTYGVYGQFYMKKNYFIQSEFYWSSKVKRSTQEYEHFQNIKHTLELDYYKLTLNAGKSISLGKKHIWFNPSFGGFISYLKKSEEFQETTLIANDTPHRNWNYGVHLNLGFQHEFNRTVLGYGINSSIGLANIFEGTEKQSSFLNVSHTITNGLYFRLGFKL